MLPAAPSAKLQDERSTRTLCWCLLVIRSFCCVVFTLYLHRCLLMSFCFSHPAPCMLTPSLPCRLFQEATGSVPPEDSPGQGCSFPSVSSPAAALPHQPGAVRPPACRPRPRPARTQTQQGPKETAACRHPHPDLLCPASCISNLPSRSSSSSSTTAAPTNAPHSASSTCPL